MRPTDVIPVNPIPVDPLRPVTEHAPPIDGRPAPAAWSPALRHYTFTMLCLVGVFNMLDRQIIAILLEPIKLDLQVSDTQMGLLSGIAFAAFYVTAGVPLARLADSGSRTRIVTVCLAVWSGATMLCGLANNFWQLALARIGVAGGEAGAAPASYSLITDLYPPSRRGTMLGLLLGVQSIGIAFGLFFGGWLNTAFDWRVAFLVVGAPGVLLAILMWLTVPEPPRGAYDPPVDPARIEVKPSYGDLWRAMRETPAMIWLVVMAMGCGFTGYAFLGWIPTFFIRTYHLSTLETGLMVGLGSTSGVIIGNIIGGRLADWFAAGRLSSYMTISAGGALLAAPMLAAVTFMPDSRSALLMLFIANVLNPLWMAPAYTAILGLAPVRVRAMTSAIISLCMTLTGVGFGPVFIGFMNDMLAPFFGDAAIRWSIALSTLGLFGGGILGLAIRGMLRRRGL